MGKLIVPIYHHLLREFDNVENNIFKMVIERLRKLSQTFRKDSSVQDDMDPLGVVGLWARKTSRSMSVVSYGHETKFKCKLTITKRKGGEPVYFKEDGSRFETCPETLKLNVDTAYSITIDMQPSMEIV